MVAVAVAVLFSGAAMYAWVARRSVVRSEPGLLVDGVELLCQPTVGAAAQLGALARLVAMFPGVELIRVVDRDGSLVGVVVVSTVKELFFDLSDVRIVIVWDVMVPIGQIQSARLTER